MAVIIQATNEARGLNGPVKQREATAWLGSEDYRFWLDVLGYDLDLLPIFVDGLEASK